MIDEEKLEEITKLAQENFGTPEVLWIPDIETGNMVKLDVNNPSEEAVAALKKLIGY